MSEELVRNLIATSDMIVNGYAFNRLGENVRAVNLNTGGAVVLLPDGTVSEAPHQVSGIQQFIKENYREMYARWQEYSDTGFYAGKVSK